jgi:hypothetical protein
MDFGGDRIAERPHQWLLEFITDIIASDLLALGTIFWCGKIKVASSPLDIMHVDIRLLRPILEMKIQTKTEI